MMNVKMKKALAVLTIAAMCMGMVACSGSSSTADESTASASADMSASVDEKNVGMANPWVDSDAEEIKEVTGGVFTETEELGTIAYQLDLDNSMGQMTFTYDGMDCCARVQPTSELEDISGMEYDNWENKEEVSMDNITGETKSVEDGDKQIQVINLFDPSTEITYSLSVTADKSVDLNGFDIQGLACSIFEF